jgi:AAA+ ATPase superfamily predicted ATPase
LGIKNNENFPPNPYVIGVPLTGDAGFYGRSETFAAVEDALYAEHQNVIVLFGQRRIGKTSLLHQIARRVRNDNRLVPVYFDLQGKERLALVEVLRLLARYVARAVGVEINLAERQ